MNSPHAEYANVREELADMQPEEYPKGNGETLNTTVAPWGNPMPLPDILPRGYRGVN